MKRNINSRLSSLMQRYSPEDYAEHTKPHDVHADHDEHHEDEQVNVDTTVAELQDASDDGDAVAAIAETQEVDPLPQENADELIDQDNGDSVVISDSTDDNVESEDDDEDMPEAEIMEAESDADIAEADAVEDEMADIAETQEALEAYAELIRGAGLDGISQQAAAFMGVGLKAAVKHAPSLEAITVSCENYDTGPRGAVTKATVSLETLSESIKEAFRKFIEWLKKRITAGRHFFKRFTSNLMAVSSELKKLETELKEYKPVGDTQWETKVSEILFTGDRFTGYDVEQLIEPSKFIVEDLPKLQTSIVKKITEKVKSINPEKIVVGDETDIFMDILKNNLSGMSNESMELPGGRTIEFDQDKGTALTMDDSFSVPDKQLTLTRTPAELRKGITDARKCMTILLKANELNDRLADAYDGLASAFDKLVKDVEKSEDSTTKELASKLRSSVVSFTDGMRVDNDRIVAYIGKCLVARISFMRKAIGANKKKSEAK